MKGSVFLNCFWFFSWFCCGGAMDFLSKNQWRGPCFLILFGCFLAFVVVGLLICWWSNMFLQFPGNSLFRAARWWNLASSVTHGTLQAKLTVSYGTWQTKLVGSYGILLPKQTILWWALGNNNDGVGHSFRIISNVDGMVCARYAYHKIIRILFVGWTVALLWVPLWFLLAMGGGAAKKVH